MPIIRINSWTNTRINIHTFTDGNAIQNVINKANRTLGFKRRNIRTEHQGIRETAYNTLVKPQAEYACPVQTPYTQTNINKVEMM